MIQAYHIDSFLPQFQQLAQSGRLTKETLLHPHFLIAKEKDVSMYYAPFDYVNKAAKIMIVGITPGWTQMQLAYASVIRAIQEGSDIGEGVRRVKQEASFAGSMRKNLTAMLNELQLPDYIGIADSASLFDEHTHLLHPCSILRYPVFINQTNYTGHNPLMTRSSLLMSWIRAVFLPELQSVQPAVIIPLGKAVSDALLTLSKEHRIAEERCLFGFPHPSGANGHRFKQFEQGKQSFINKLRLCF